MIWLLLPLSIISAILYRAGGMAKDSQEKYSSWIPVWLRHSWVRDWLCPLCVLILWIPATWFQWIIYCLTFGHTAVPALGFEMIMWLSAYGATGGFLSTYWDFMFGYDNYLFSGFAVGLAGLFLIGLGQPWMPLLARSFILAVCWGAWSALLTNADFEEYGRGFFLVATMGVLI